MIGKKITVDTLAMMIQTGFAEVYEKMASKEDLLNLRLDMKEELTNYATRKDLQNLRLELKEDLLDMEDRLYMRSNKRIDRLESDMERVKAKLKLA